MKKIKTCLKEKPLKKDSSNNKNLNKNRLKPILKYVKENKQKSICFLLIGFFASILLFAVVKSSFNKEAKLVKQVQVHPDSFFSTTRRNQKKERIIIIYRDGQIIKKTEKLDNRGKVKETKSEVLSEADEVVRGNDLLRTGEELKDGDVVGERIMNDGNGVRKEKDIIQGNEIKTIISPLDDMGNAIYLNENDVRDGVEISAVIHIIDGKQYVVKEFITKEAKVFKKVFDEHNNIVKEGTILSDEIIGRQEDNTLRRISKIVSDGDIVTLDRKVRDVDRDDKFNLNAQGLFEFEENKAIGITEEDEIKIARIKNERNSKNSGSIKFVNSSPKEVNDLTIYNRDKNYSEHNEPRTTPTYPVDLTRVLTMDRIIPAVLITEIKSDIPSKKVLAQTEQDIYGSHGRKILIPKGSKVIGAYERLEDRAIRRMAVVWYRIITPSGINIKLEGELNDSAGVSGITGEIDRRMLDRYGNAFLLSSINALAQLSVPVNDLSARAAADSFTREFSAVTGQLIRESLKVMPTIRIPQGTRINISPLQDIWFKDAQNNKIKVLSYNNNEQQK